MGSKRADQREIERLERELLDDGPRDPTQTEWDGFGVGDRLFAIGILSTLAGGIWAAILTSTGSAAGRSDTVFDHGVAGYIAAALLGGPLCLLMLFVAGTVLWALVAIALGRNLDA